MTERSLISYLPLAIRGCDQEKFLGDKVRMV